MEFFSIGKNYFFFSFFFFCGGGGGGNNEIQTNIEVRSWSTLLRKDASINVQHHKEKGIPINVCQTQIVQWLAYWTW